LTSSVIGTAGGAGNSGRIEVELTNKWRIEIIGNTENGGIWRLINTDSTVITSRTLPPHAYWPNNRYTTAYTIIDTIKTLYLRALETNLRLDGYKDLKEYVERYGKSYSVKGYSYLYLLAEGMAKPRYILRQLLEMLGIHSYYMELREIDFDRYRVELYTVPRPVDTWFLRGLTITDGDRVHKVFSSPRNELLSIILANTMARIELRDIKLWSNEVKITLSTRIHEKPFEWVNKVMEAVEKDVDVSAMLPKTLGECLELLAGIIAGDGFVNRTTKIITISLSFRTSKGRAILKILEYLADLGILELRWGIKRVESHREIKIWIPYETKLELAKLIPYYKGYRIVPGHRNPVVIKTKKSRRYREEHNTTSIEIQPRVLDTHTLQNLIKTIVERYIHIISYASIEHNIRSGSRLRITCLEREPCKNLAEELRRIGLSPVTSYSYRKTFTIRKGKELIAQILEHYGKLRLSEEIQRIYSEWLKRIQP